MVMTDFTLKDIEKLQEDRVYKVGNLSILKSKESNDFVWSKYSMESYWHKFYTTESFFGQISHIPLEDTGRDYVLKL